MFDNSSNIYLFNYEVQLDSVVKIICDISFDIGKQIEEFIELKKPEEGFTIEDLFNEKFLREISIRPEALQKQVSEEGKVIEGYTNEEFFAIIAGHFNQTLFNVPAFLKGLEGSDILLVNKRQTNFLCLGEKARDRLIPALKGAKILKELTVNLNSEKIRNSLQKIDMFENDIFYKNTINAVKQESQPLLPFINKDFLNLELADNEKIDSDDYWVNYSLYSSFGITLPVVDEFILLKDKETKKELGIVISDIVLLFPNINLPTYVKDKKLHEFYWLLLVNTYTTNKAATTEIKDEGVKDFKKYSEDIELNQLLSYLKNNFYLIDEGLIKEKYAIFFNKVVYFDKLDSLDGYQFLMSSNFEEETALGVYTTAKKGTSYNLLHWLNHQGSAKINHYRSTIPVEKKKKLIFTLKPAICYYFLEKYFEDFFESILKKNGYEFFANKTFLDKTNIFCEVDFFVATKSKFYYFETKTKLSKFYIEDFLKKSSKMMDRFKPMTDNGIEVQYILLGAYSDENVKEYQYFIDESSAYKALGYNIPRENLNCIPYYFKVPIPDKEGTQITCIAEPQYENLQSLVLQLCQK